jgi:leucyl aminopeptidase
MAKKPNQSKLTVINTPLDQFKGDALAIALYKNTKSLPAQYASLDRKIGGLITRALDLGDAANDSNQLTVLYMPEKMSFQRLILIGLGEQKDLKINTLRQAAGTVARFAAKLKTKSLGLSLHLLLDNDIITPEIAAQTIAEGAIYATYNYSEFMTAQNNNTSTDIALVLPTAANFDKLKKGFIAGSIIAESQNYARNITNKPGNVINPPALAAEAQKLARQHKLKCKIFDEKQLAKMDMNAILAVGCGSVKKPRLIVLEYNGKKSAKKSASPDAIIIGKGITFDSGGLSIKPTDSMVTMKNDKAGACDVLGIMAALSRLKLPIHVVGLMPAAENLLSSTCYRPDDIIRTASGRTVEIISTDAEGRLVLADALTYATRMKPRVMIDIATLTGGCVVALGTDRAGLFGNDQTLIDKVNAAAEKAGEPLWPMPSGPEYLEKMKSKSADLKNAGGREGAACTAAAFLRQFAENIPWTHLDIAGTDTFSDEKPWRGTGATGFSVRIVLEYLRSL